MMTRFERRAEFYLTFNKSKGQTTKPTKMSEKSFVLPDGAKPERILFLTLHTTRQA
jgi:hypothetical protein